MAQAPAWSVNPADYSNSMSIVAQIQLDGSEENGGVNLLAAYVNGEIRGVVSPLLISGKAYYFLTVHSNIAQGELVKFQVYLASSNSTHPAVEEVPFKKNQQLGVFPEGFKVNISLDNDFPIALLPIPGDTTLMGVAFYQIALPPHLQSQDSDPVAWSVGTSTNLIGIIDGTNNLQATPLDPTWTGTDSLLVTATETGTPHSFSASQWVHFTVQEDYGAPVFENFPVQFVQNDVPLPSGDLNQRIGFDGPCLDYSVELMLPEGTADMPSWSQPSTNSGSMILVVQANFGGNPFAGANNKLAGFVNDQLAGVASPQVVDGEILYFITLANMGKGVITLKLYDEIHHFVHERNTETNFLQSGSHGNFNNPFTVDFGPFLVDLQPDGNWTTAVVDEAWSGEQQVLFIARDCKYTDRADSSEVVFLVKQCSSQQVELPVGSGFCLKADESAADITWFLDGTEDGAGEFHGALMPGVYHYEALTVLGCPDLKSCPVVVYENGSAPPLPGDGLPTQPPPACGQITLTEIAVDNVQPTAVCKPATVFLDNNGEATLTPADVDGGSFTNCGSGILSVSQNSFDCQNLGYNSVVLTVADITGKTSSCKANVTVWDKINPSVVCKNITKNLNGNGAVSIFPTNVFLSGNDNCGTVNLVSVVPNSFTCSNLGNNTVTLKVNDGHGNTKTCVATVTVQDNTPPTVTCKPYNLFLNANGSGSIVALDVFQNFSDNCGQMNFVSVVPNTFDCSTYGVQPVTLTINDGHGNTDACTTTVTVSDNIAPTPICPATISNVVLDENGEGSLPANIGDGSSTDNCGTATETSPPLDLTCADLGQKIVFLSVNDGHGNTGNAICSFNVVDNMGPTLACQDIVISLGSNGNTTLTPAQVFDTINSSDNCGGINLVSVLPNTFTCQQEGANYVALLANDGHGNTATCNATVTVNEFITNISIVPTAESCTGAGNGAITISATAGGGQIKYSIDNGANFSASGAFTNLSPGTYNIVIKVFGIPNVCEETGTAIVESGGTSTAWYKDADNDGHSDGISQMSCTRPSGYKTSAELNGHTSGDCNDNNPLEYPGQVWWQDNDNDNYSSGTSSIACQRPSGYKTTNELAAADVDCDDSNMAIHPGATEICNGIDDDCDGEIDEDGGGGLTYVGNIAFSNQAAVDAFSQCYSIIDGSVTISGGSINDLSNLGNLEEITGNVTIQYTGLLDMDGLDSLAEIGGTLTIYFNSSLEELGGMDSLATVGGSLSMYYNFKLSDCCAFYNLLNNGGVAGNVVIFYNKSGCNSASEVINNCGPPIPPPLIGGPTNEIATGQSLDVKEVTLFPNPAKGIFSVAIPDGFTKGDIAVIDMYGCTVLGQTLEEGQRVYQLEAGLLPSGMYMVVVQTPDQPAQAMRLIVE